MTTTHHPSHLWAIEPRALAEREARLARAPALRAPAARAPEPIHVDANGVATIQGVGVLTAEPDALAEFFGEQNTTYKYLSAALASALASDSVREIVWSIDSPGGEAVPEYYALLDQIATARASGGKPMRVVVGGRCCSAAYGIAAAAGPITASHRTSTIGSVGIVCSRLEIAGLEIRHITSSSAPDKRPDWSTPQGEAVVRRELDQHEAELVGAIGRGRGTPADTVRKSYGRGASMLATHALAAGMIDRVASPDLSRANSTAIAARVSNDVAARVDHAAATLGTSNADAHREALEIGLSEIERYHADQIKDPEQRARFVARRLERNAPKPVDPMLVVGSDGLNAIERDAASKMKDPAARARFVANRLARRAKK